MTEWLLDGFLRYGTGERILFLLKIVEAFKDPEIFDIDALKKIGCTNYK